MLVTKWLYRPFFFAFMYMPYFLLNINFILKTAHHKLPVVLCLNPILITLLMFDEQVYKNISL